MMRQVQPATKTAVPPSGTATAGLSGNAGASPSLGAGLRPLFRCRPGSGAGVPGAVAPGEINQKTPPSPRGKGGVGGWGKEIHDAAGSAGDQNRRPPYRGQRRQGYPSTPGQAPRRRVIRCPCPSAARVQPRGCKGRSPLHKKTKNLPLSHGGRALCERGSGGWGKNLVIWLVNPATEKSNYPSKPTVAKKTVSRRRRTPLPPCSQSTSSTRQSGRTVRSDGCSTYRRISLKAEA